MKFTGMHRFLTLLSLTALTLLMKCQAGPISSKLRDSNNQQRQSHGEAPLLTSLVDRIHQSGAKSTGELQETSHSVDNAVIKGEKPNSSKYKMAAVTRRSKRATLPVPLMSIRMAPIEFYGLSERNVNLPFEERERRKFPEVDSRGFDEDIFDEGFGEFHPMKRWPH